ncbi:ChbG/HpnK family deacetylase [Streptomyces sp. NPDC020802]|uniref:ChbG/HpnK family deacetylase n=1 Tax=Streptomyces sp. NPDC020802 TaxID=3365094 RepID=UPI003796064B
MIYPVHPCGLFGGGDARLEFTLPGWQNSRCCPASCWFPADARVLVVDCDDFGMRRGVNAAVVETIESGIAAWCSLMVPCGGTEEAMGWLPERSELRSGSTAPCGPSCWRPGRGGARPGGRC